MMAIWAGLALAAVAQGGDHDHGRFFFRLTIERYLPGRETVFELYEVGEGASARLLVDRRVSELGGGSHHDVTVRECSALGAVLDELPRMRMPTLHVEGVSPTAPVVPFDLGTSYELVGFTEHPNGDFGEIAMSTNDPGDTPGSGEADPLRRWADGLAAVYEACLESD